MITFIAGLFVGALLGMLTTALMVSAGRADDHAERPK